MIQGKGKRVVSIDQVSSWPALLHSHDIIGIHRCLILTLQPRPVPSRLRRRLARPVHSSISHACDPAAVSTPSFSAPLALWSFVLQHSLDMLHAYHLNILSQYLVVKTLSQPWRWLQAMVHNLSEAGRPRETGARNSRLYLAPASLITSK
jgi:hypothetical protein